MALTNLSVRGLGSDNQTLLMPKLQFRFRLIFSNFGTSGNDTNELTRQVIDCSRPNLSFAKISVPVYNSTIYLAGKHTWNTMSINLRDDASGAISKLVGAQLQKQLNMTEQASAGTGGDYKFALILQMLDGSNGTQEPIALETWYISGAYLEAVNYNTVNYGTSEVVTIALTVQYDNAIQTSGGVGVEPQERGSPTGVATGLGGGAGGGGGGEAADAAAEAGSIEA
jgi:hypothetical protein